MIHQIIIRSLFRRVPSLRKDAICPLDGCDLLWGTGQTDDAVIKMLQIPPQNIRRIAEGVHANEQGLNFISVAPSNTIARDILFRVSGHTSGQLVKQKIGCFFPKICVRYGSAVLADWVKRPPIDGGLLPLISLPPCPPRSRQPGSPCSGATQRNGE